MRENRKYSRMLLTFVVAAVLLSGFASLFTGSQTKINSSSMRFHYPEGWGTSYTHSRVIDEPWASSTTNEEGNNFVEVTNGTTPAVEAYVGQPGVSFGVQLQSLKDDDGVETNGDDVLYNVNVSIVTDSDMIYYEDPVTGELTPISSLGISNPFRSVWVDTVENSRDAAGNYDALYGGSGPKYVPNWDNQWLDENDNWQIENSEVWQISNGPVDFIGLKFNLSGDIPAGYYAIPVNVQYQYYDYIPIARDGINKTIPHNMLGWTGDIFTDQPTEFLGGVQWYWWTPVNRTSGSTPTFGEPDETTPTTHNIENVTFEKVYPYVDGVLDISQLSGMAYNNTGDLNATWYAIRDDHVNEGGTYDWNSQYIAGDPFAATTTPFMDLNASWDDGNSTGSWGWASNVDWIDGAGGDGTGNNPPAGYATVEQMWDAWRDMLGSNSWTIDRFPTLDGNGTWRYSGYLPDAEWHQGNATLGNITVFTETEYVFIKVISTGSNPGGNPTPTWTLQPVDGDNAAGEDFEPWQLTFTNNDPSVDVDDLTATLTLPSEGGFSFYGGFDTVSVDNVPANGGTADLVWRINTPADTPPGIYDATITVTYNKSYPAGTNNHVTLWDTVTITETIPVQMLVDFTPGLSASLPVVRAYTASNVQIDNSVGEHTFIMNVDNAGNTKIYGGPNGTNNIEMSFARFERVGNDIYDSDVSQFVELDPIMIPELEVGESTTVNVPIKINNHWNLDAGTYRLMLDFMGFYYDDGSTGNPTGFVAFKIVWEGAPLQPVMYRDLTAPFYPDTNWDAGEAAEPANGIYADITVLDFMDAANNLREMPALTFSEYQNTMTQGAGTTTVHVKVENTGNADITDFRAELLVNELDVAAGGSFLAGESYYEGDNAVGVNPVVTLDTLPAGGNATLEFTIEGIDSHIPPGLHKIPIAVSGAYWDGRWNDPEIVDYDPLDAATDEYSRYNIVWDTSSLPFEAYIDENENGVYDGGDTRFDADPAVELTVDDTMPDVLVTMNWMDNLYLGDPYSNNGNLWDRTIRVNVKNNELYPLTDVAFQLECGPTTPILNPVDHTATTVDGTPSSTTINPGSTITVTFIVDVNDNFTAGSYAVNVIMTDATNGNTLQPAITSPQSYPVNLRLYPVPPYVTVEDYTTSAITPGNDFTVSLTLKNNGGDDARNVIVAVDSELFNDDAFDLIDAFVSSVSSAEYNVDLNGDGSADGPYVVSKMTNTTLSDLAIDNITDIISAERMLRDPVAKITVFYFDVIPAGETLTLTLNMHADIHMVKGRQYTEEITVGFEDSRGTQRTNGPYQITLKTDSEGVKIVPEVPPEVATKDELKNAVESTAEQTSSLANLLYLILAIVAVMFIIMIVTMMRKPEEPTGTTEAIEEEAYTAPEPHMEETITYESPEEESISGGEEMPEELPEPEEIPPVEEEEIPPIEEEELPEPEEEGEAEEAPKEGTEEDWSLDGEELPEPEEEGEEDWSLDEGEEETKEEE